MDGLTDVHDWTEIPKYENKKTKKADFILEGVQGHDLNNRGTFFYILTNYMYYLFCWD